MERPTFEEFESDLLAFFPEPLTSKSKTIAFNFWTNWQEINNHVKTRRLKIALPSFVLDNYVDRNYPRYKMFKKIKNASMAILLIAIMFSFGLAIKFVMPEAIIVTAFVITPAVFVAGIMPYSYMEVTKFTYGINMIRKVKNRITSDTPAGGMTALCASYIAGQVGLQTKKGVAFCPDYPCLVL